MPANARAKLSFVRSTGSEDRERLKRACVGVVSSLKTILQIAADVVGDAGVPGLRAGLTGLLFLLDVAKKTHQNGKDIGRMAEHLGELTAIFQRSRDGKALSKGMVERMDRLSRTWQAAADEVQTVVSRHALLRFLHYSDVAQAITDHIRDITWSIQNFTVETLLSLDFALDEHAHFMKNTTSRIEDKIDSGFQQMNAKLDLKDGTLPYAILAQFDYKVRDHCLEGTRTDVLDQIYRWIGFDALQHQGDPVKAETSFDTINEETPCIFWINGSAGTGKTTIACTVAKECAIRGILGASFFCSRDDAECSNPNLIFTTIAQQLGQFCPAFETHLNYILKSKPDIGYSSVPYQLQELIVKPLTVVRKFFPKCVVVVDALDECKDNGSTSIVLSSLSRYVRDLEPLRILITSRPEPQVTTGFKSGQLRQASQRLVLHEISLDVVQHDIELYLTASLRRIGQFYGLEETWPSQQDILALAHLSSGLFIFAATAARFIEDRNYSNPKHQLSTLLLDVNSSTESSSSPHRHLDRLYAEVLLHAFPDISPLLAGRLKMVLGTIVLLPDLLSPSALERLLNLSSNTIRGTLAHLHSIVIVPEDDIGVIRMIHPSFFDFMTNPARCAIPRFMVNTKTQHTLLAHACLETLCRWLKRDICGIKDPSVLNSEIDDLPIQIQKCIYPHLRYACRHWAFHFANSMISDVLVQLMEEFCSGHLLHWVEVCSLLGELRNALLALDVAQQTLHLSPKVLSDVSVLLHDCERFTREFFPVLSIASLQVYYSALLFTPRSMLIYSIYHGESQLPMTAYNAMGDTWTSCIRTTEAHRCSIESVAISRDGTRLLTGSVDYTIRLWDIVSGVHLNTFAGHLAAVSSVAFSPDGTRIVSGSFDKTLRLWDTCSGAHLTTFTGHTDPVLSVASSFDGTCLVSGSYDRTVRLWNAVSGALLHTFRGHSSGTWSVEFSPDGKRVVSGCRDGSVRLWDVVNGTCLNILVGHSETVLSAAFSPDGQRVLSSSYDKTLRLWDAYNGNHLRTLKGHTEPVTSATFSSDSARIVSGSYDSTVRLWNTADGAQISTLTGHSDWIQSVVFSPDGTRVVSGSNDGTLRLWDVTGVAHSDTFPGHSAWVCSLAFSPDGTHLASGSHDRTLQIWDVASGAHLKTLVGHFDAVASIAFSPNGKYIASGSYDMSVRLWDAITGAHISTLTGQPDWIHTVAFSPDSRHIVSESPGKTVVMWDTVSGALLGRFTGNLSAATIANSHTSFDSGKQIDDKGVTHSRIPDDRYMMEEEWIVCTTTKRRVCWVPVAFRPYCLASRADRVALGTRGGRVIILDLTGFIPDVITIYQTTKLP